ncbi:hypothetical protein FOMA001_g17510 [Fusarium oxysporum f. sp. matthiolae]|nr:hypothetical protein FOMA001_g17510 [Fusarium oxysporum f. sp. matthiolae]
MIEIAMDDDLPSGSDQASEASPPAPASHRSHNRGRRIGDSSSISDLIRKATRRLRSASRSRKEYVRSPFRGSLREHSYAPTDEVSPTSAIEP